MPAPPRVSNASLSLMLTIALWSALVRSMWKRGRFRPLRTTDFALLLAPPFRSPPELPLAESLLRMSPSGRCVSTIFFSLVTAPPDSEPTSAMLKMGFQCLIPSSPGATLGNPKPAATRARLVQRLLMEAKCQSTTEGEAYLSS